MLRTEILCAVEGTHTGMVVLDMTAVDIVDAADVQALLAIVRSCALMGAGVRLAGLRPSLCALMADLPGTDRLEAYLGVEEALQAAERTTP